MRMYDIIRKKRDGEIITDEEIHFWIDGLTDGTIPDYQTSALLMAIYLNGLTNHELATITLAMSKSGDIIDLSPINGVTIDKHSTGGVGDKTTLIVAPIVAALGGKIAKMSGRGLGHTGGTVDKLESISGFSTEVAPDRFLRQVNDIGICLAGQSGNLAPADKKIYAIRDVTATVESIPLIASSIMSKKIASGSANIVLDVKTGSGAFMKTIEDSKMLAQTMVNIGYSVGRNTSAVITNMDIPLGNAVGNVLEVKECIEILNGGGNADLREICIVLAVHMAMLVTGKNEEETRKDVIRVIDDGSALEKFRQVVIAQGGDVSLIDNPDKMPKAGIIEPITADKSGYIEHMDTEKVGIASVILGAGRERINDSIDYSAGIILKAKTGDFVNAGDVIAEFHTNRAECLQNAKDIFGGALVFGDKPVPKPQIIYAAITSPSEG